MEQLHLTEYESTGIELKTFDIGTVGGSKGIAFGNTIGRVYVLNPAAVRLVAVPPAGPFTVPGSEVPIDVKPSHAKVKAIIVREGSPTTYHFEYGETTAYGSVTLPAPLSEAGGLFTAVSVTADLTGLKPNTVYHFRTVAENKNGETTFGPDATLTTPPAVVISGESVTQVTPESARLNVEISPQGAATGFHFEYGLSSVYEHSVPVPDANAGADEISASYSILIEHLSPGTVYHYHVVAENEFGTVERSDHVFSTTTSGVAPLADGRVWEMVSPPTKNGSSLEAISEEGGLIQASEQGDALGYIGRGPVGAEAPPQGSQNIADSQFVARRSTPGVWATRDITTPHERPAGFHPDKRAEYLFFSGDLSKGLVEPFGETRLSPEASEKTPYLREIAGNYTPLVTSHNVPPGTKFGGTETGGGDYTGGLELVGASADASTAAITSPLALTNDYTTPEGNGNLQSIYRWSGDTKPLQLVSWLPATTATPTETPTALAGDKASLGFENVIVRHAVSTDGNRLIYQAEDNSGAHAQLFLRDMRLGKSVRLDLHKDGTAGLGLARFQDASADGRVVFFTDQEHLTSDATGNSNESTADLYRCEVQEIAGGLECRLKNLTVPLGAGEAADVRGNIVGSDESGDRVYFVANGRLTAGAVHGDCPPAANASVLPPAATACNLYAYDAPSGETRLVAVLSGRDFPAWGGEEVNNLMYLAARVSLNGRYLAFMSQRSLTGYDNRDARSGVPDEEVFRYDFERAQLSCVSCDRTGARPNGVFDSGAYPGLLVDRPKIWKGQWVAASIPGWTNVVLTGPPVRAAYQSRYLANNGRVFFNSSENLVPGDVNGQFDVYQYEPAGAGSCGPEGACVALMSSGHDGGETAFLDADITGENVFFLTAAKLAPNDTDIANDVYDAHVCVSAAACSPTLKPSFMPCEELASCRSAPPAQSAGTAPAALGGGNLAPVARSAKPLTRAQRFARALKACKKQHGKRRKACEAGARRRYGPKRANTKSTKSGSRHVASNRRRHA